MSLAGQKRDKICEALVDLTVNLFFREPSLQESRREHLESLIAIVQLLTGALRPRSSRALTHSSSRRGVPKGSVEEHLATGAGDVQRLDSQLERGGRCDPEADLRTGTLRTLVLRLSPPPSLISRLTQENDSLTSAYSTSQSLIPRFDLASLFDNGSLPDFSHGDLLIALDYLLSGGPLSYKAIQAATANATTWVAGAFRIFSVISLELPRTSRLSPLLNAPDLDLPSQYRHSSTRFARFGSTLTAPTLRSNDYARRSRRLTTFLEAMGAPRRRSKTRSSSPSRWTFASSVSCTSFIGFSKG